MTGKVGLPECRSEDLLCFANSAIPIRDGAVFVVSAMDLAFAYILIERFPNGVKTMNPIHTKTLEKANEAAIYTLYLYLCKKQILPSTKHSTPS